MNRNKSQLARLTELDRQIRSRRYPNCISFAQEWGVSQKTIQRDIDFMRDQNHAPIEYSREFKGFFYTNETWTLPAVILTEGELLSLLLSSRALEPYEGTPVAAHLKQLFAKLSDLLPEKISIKPEYLFSRFFFRGPAVNAVNENIWSTVVQGLLSQRVLKIAYRPFEATLQKNKTSRICPYHIANLQGEWYVFGVHEGYEDVRQFALARIEKADLTTKSFMIADDFDPRALLEKSFGRYVGNEPPHKVRLRFTNDIADWITGRQWHPSQTLERKKNGDVELVFQATSLFEVQRWILSWGRWVTVLEPKELVGNVADEIKAMEANQTAETRRRKYGDK